NATIGPYFAPAAFQIRRTNDDLLFLGFPPGFPALMALVVALARTPTAVHYAAPLLTLIGLVATYFVGALAGGRRAVGLWAVLLLAASPSFWQFGTAAWSEAPSLALGTAGAALFLAARRSARTGQSRMLALAAGLLLAYNIFVRYANVAILPGFLLFDLWRARTALFRPNRRWWFYLPLVAGVAAVPLFNMVYYGGPLITSYNPLHGWYPHAPFALGYAFGPSFVGGRSLLEMPPLLWANFGFFLLALPVGWILLPRPVALLTAAAALLTMGLYGIYAFAPVGINSRFLLPIFPFLCVPMAQTIVEGGQWLGDRLRTRFPRAGWASVGQSVAAMVLLLLMFRPLPDTLAALEQRTRDGAAVASRMQELTAGTPDDSVFLSYEFNDHIAYYG
ncbi:MAG: phospholipid carrier-dependent glycosyltransferase, partial [Caldilineaceae bacterium]|nr:phospholipid carrier-dependent glycosyltransferase [Caldilineaceae bacterium]